MKYLKQLYSYSIGYLYNILLYTMNYINQTKIGNYINNSVTNIVSNVLIKYNDFVNTDNITYCAYIDKVIDSDNNNFINIHYSVSPMIIKYLYKLYSNKYYKTVNTFGYILNNFYKDKLMIIEVNKQMIFYNFDNIQNMFDYINKCQNIKFNEFVDTYIMYLYTIIYEDENITITYNLENMLNHSRYNTLNNIINYILSESFTNNISKTNIFNHNDINSFNMDKIISNNNISIKRFNIIDDEEKIYKLSNLSEYINNETHITDIINDINNIEFNH